MQAWNWMRIKPFWSQHRPSHHRFWLLRQEPLSRWSTRNRVTNGWVACCLQPVPRMQLWILLITICNLQVELSLPTNWFFWAEMCPSETSWNFSMPSWHQSLVLELGPVASIVRIWSNLISTFDVCSALWLELQAGFAGEIRGTNFCIIGISACEKWLMRVTWKHGQKTAFLNNGHLLAT